MVAYHCSCNVILVDIFCSKQNRHRFSSYNNICRRIQQYGHEVHLQILDNEASAEYRRTIKEECKTTYQLVPPHLHRHNYA